MAKNLHYRKLKITKNSGRIMQKQTFEQIKEIKERIRRIEYMIVVEADL